MIPAAESSRDCRVMAYESRKNGLRRQEAVGMEELVRGYMMPGGSCREPADTLSM